MVKRTLTGIAMAGFLFLVIWLASFSHFVFDMLVLAVGAVSSYEIYAAVKKADTRIEGKKGYNISIVSIVLAVVTSYPLCYFFGYLGLFFCFIISVLCAFVIFIFDDKKTFNDFAVNIFAVVYPTILLSIVYILNNNYGMIPVLLAIGISTVSDAAAYFIGSALGKKKIFPKISPKKTYAGCIGGVLGGALGGIIVYLIFELGGFPTHTLFTFTALFNGNKASAVVLYVVIGAIMAVFSEIGDLAASRVKRQVGIKDYGKMLGSHGGMMDRIDSILFSISAMGIIMEIIRICGKA
jgi:phosphatidate cytidylyltransferase